MTGFNSSTVREQHSCELAGGSLFNNFKDYGTHIAVVKFGVNEGSDNGIE